MKTEQTVVLGLINTTSGKHLVIHRLKTNDYGFPGGKANEGENLLDALIREIKEETGLSFKSEDFTMINGQVKEQDGKTNLIFTYACNKTISDSAKLSTVEKHIQPMFMQPSIFYTLTSYKEYYVDLFEGEEDL